MLDYWLNKKNFSFSIGKDNGKSYLFFLRYMIIKYSGLNFSLLYYITHSSLRGWSYSKLQGRGGEEENLSFIGLTFTVTSTCKTDNTHNLKYWKLKRRGRWKETVYGRCFPHNVENGLDHLPAFHHLMSLSCKNFSKSIGKFFIVDSGCLLKFFQYSHCWCLRLFLKKIICTVRLLFFEPFTLNKNCWVHRRL